MPGERRRHRFLVERNDPRAAPLLRAVVANETAAAVVAVRDREIDGEDRDLECIANGGFEGVPGGSELAEFEHQAAVGQATAVTRVRGSNGIVGIQPNLVEDGTGGVPDRAIRDGATTRQAGELGGCSGIAVSQGEHLIFVGNERDEASAEGFPRFEAAVKEPRR